MRLMRNKGQEMNGVPSVDEIKAMDFSQTDDVIVLTITHDYAERQRSYELLAEVIELKGEGRKDAAPQGSNG